MSEKFPLDKPTMSPQELADLHNVPLKKIQQQLAKGIKAELEHTSDKKVAREIALDHLLELPNYYDKLEKMEESRWRWLREGISHSEITQQDLDKLEYYLDKLYGQLGLDVEFSAHFLDRVNDERNKRQITLKELARLFQLEYKKYGPKIREIGPQAEAVFKDMRTDVNVPFVLKRDRFTGDLVILSKTVMRKKNFRTSDKEFAVEVKIWLPDPKNTLGIKRSNMPQVKSNKYDDLVAYLESHDAHGRIRMIPAKDLNPIQGEFSEKGVLQSLQKFVNLGDSKAKPLITSSDNYIIDGHHRWLATMNTRPNEAIKVLQFNKSVKELLNLVLSFPHTYFKSIYEGVEKIRLTDLREVLIHKNPTPEQFKKLVDSVRSMRGVTDGKNHWVWDSYEGVHYEVARGLGLGDYVGYAVVKKPNFYKVIIEDGNPDSVDEILDSPSFQRIMKKMNYHAPINDFYENRIWETLLGR